MKRMRSTHFKLTILWVVLTLIGFTFGDVYAESRAGNLNLEPDSSIESLLAVEKKTRLGTDVQPFGHQLFQGAFRRSTQDGLNPNYKIAPGDKVGVRIWGATAFDDVLVVDMQGNLFIPTVGPVSVGGVSNARLNDRVTKAVRTVFTKNVNVYTSLSTAQPVAVYVAGYVNNPGHYAGVPSSSVLYFLDHAGGVDFDRGSYRTVKVIRNNKTIANIDLYTFLLEGKIESLQFKDGDTIFVGAQLSSISVLGEVRNSNSFELEDDHFYKGEDILGLAIPSTVVTHASVIGFREGKRFAKYMSIDNFKSFKIDNGDMVTLKSDLSEEMIVVEIEGEYQGQSQYVLPKNSRIHELLNYIEIDPDESEVSSISIKRKSIASKQRAALADSLNRIESAYFTASSQTNEEASIRVQESKMIGEFINRARAVEPNGRLVLAQGENIRNVRLEMGDVITIPRKLESVMVNGEVMVSQAILWDKSLSLKEYISMSGGLTDQAKSNSYLLVKQSGEVVKGTNFAIDPGDEIIVMPKVPVKSLQTASSISDILYKIAIAASVAIKL